MHTALLIVTLAIGGSPQATHNPPDPAEAFEPATQAIDAPLVVVGPSLPPPISKRPFSWLAYVRQSHYAPGALRNPINSWFDHPYLAFRGNYYCNGYDYLRQHDYPWHPGPRRPPAVMPHAVGLPVHGATGVPAGPQNGSLPEVVPLAPATPAPSGR